MCFDGGECSFYEILSILEFYMYGWCDLFTMNFNWTLIVP